MVLAAEAPDANDADIETCFAFQFQKETRSNCRNWGNVWPAFGFPRTCAAYEGRKDYRQPRETGNVRPLISHFKTDHRLAGSRGLLQVNHGGLRRSEGDGCSLSRTR